MKWISVDDMLPKVDDKILVYSKFKSVQACAWRRDGRTTLYGYEPGRDFKWWMPQPEPPEGKTCST